MISKEVILDSVDGPNKTLFSELLDDHEGLKKAYLSKDYEKALLKGGKFVETLFKNLEFLRTGEVIRDIDFEVIMQALKNTKRDDYDDSIRLIIPRIGTIVYMFRSKRGGAHRTERDPLEIDANFCYNSVKYIVAELVRLYSNLNEEIIKDYLGHVLTKDLPFVEEFEDGRITILVDTGSCREDLLLVLYNFYPQRLTNEDIKKHLIEFYTAENITTSLGNTIKSKLVDRNENGSMLTRKGVNYIEERYYYSQGTVP